MMRMWLIGNLRKFPWTLMKTKNRKFPRKKKFLFPSKCSEHPVDHHGELEGPNDPVDLVVVPKIKKTPTWIKSTLQEAEGHAALCDSFRESKRPKSYSGYAGLMTNLIDVEPSTFEEASS